MSHVMGVMCCFRDEKMDGWDGSMMRTEAHHVTNTTNHNKQNIHTKNKKTINNNGTNTKHTQTIHTQQNTTHRRLSTLGGHNQQREGERIMVEWSDIYGVNGDENERI